MQVIHWGRARRFFQKNKPAERPLKEWRAAVQRLEWKHFADVQNTFGDADLVDGLLVFNIKGNDYRLIAIAQYANDKLYIRHVLTHAEYDLNKWKPTQKKKR
jgi:mRNA interferase HigB